MKSRVARAKMPSEAAQAPRPPWRVALAGNPNAGKTTVFNALCGARQQTGNYAGVTVEKKSGILKGYPDVEILDLPGTYSLKATSADERIAADVIHGETRDERKPDLIVSLIDASNLKRSLYLTLQLKAQGIPMVGAVTMTDIAARRGVAVDLAALADALGFPVFEVTLASAGQIAKLAEGIGGILLKPVAAKVSRKAAESGIDEIYSEIDKLLRKVVRRSEARNPVTARIDSILTHRLFGFAAFALIIGTLFFSIYAGARPVMDGIDAGMKYIATLMQDSLAGYPVTASLMADGVIAGAGSVLVFVPQIAILFFFLAILEETGYLARAAFLMDKLLGWSGLNGRAFIPLLSSFACAVPGILSARVMPTDRARMATILIAPLMSCSARLPVYLLFIGAFIEPRFGALVAAICLFGMHLVGIAVAMPMAWLLNRKILKSEQSPFILELPEYHMPHWPNVWRRVYDAARNFLVRVGTIIFALSIVIWALAYFPHDRKKIEADFARTESINATRVQPVETRENDLRAAYLKDSYLGRFGRAAEPVFKPLGFDWKISVAILAAFPAREVFVSTLGIIFSVTGAKDDPAALGKRLLREKKADGSAAYTALMAFSVLIFFALCAQCMSTLATIRRELGGAKWAIGVFVAMTSLAYVISLMVYQIGIRVIA